ncbi:Hydroperoxy fatty acid reductase gpx1 [Maioricimonas rarisocia]|uniref:Glutathione peroxidase n=1 Tax=Maioricimonas rarisocia TaxID=2528026 RepID=A0A517Z4C4_9PLAN|nr:glutathione peroxidase [Maioricimonas rarisocia]QDU37285.1 Hydroperoxy fatty acid reductase gpx1 [Maioricimonas rarisocia]
MPRGLSRNLLLAACILTLSLGQFVAAESQKDSKVDDALSFKMESLTGDEVDLSKYRGKVVLMVNVASECGATPQYAPLQGLYSKYKDKGLVVLGFPCNQFGSQEPGTSQEIRQFCTANYGVTFPMFAKINVNGEEAAPLYKYLTSKETNPKHAGPIGWNFEKFLIDRDGNVVERFPTPVDPASDDVVEAIERELAEEK